MLKGNWKFDFGLYLFILG